MKVLNNIERHLDRIATALERLCGAPAAPAFAPSRKCKRGDAWSEDEDRILIDMRKYKVPYKKIAKKLKGRTESACYSRAKHLRNGAKS